MSQELQCPACGGLIFSDDVEAMENAPCTCTAAATSNQPSAVASGASGASMSSMASVSPRSSMTAGSGANGAGVSSIAAAALNVPPRRPAASSAPGEQKLCCNCGKDVTGRKRLKDSQGRYWCPQCGKKDEKQKLVRQEQTKTACTLCGTEVEVQNLQTYDGQFVCNKCYHEKKDLEKKTDARINRINKSFEGQDFKRLIPMFAIMGILALIMLLRTFHIIGGR